jgi:hypothetical protein
MQSTGAGSNADAKLARGVKMFRVFRKRKNGHSDHFEIPPLARSIEDVVAICGACGTPMRLEAEDLVCDCGHRVNADDVFYDIAIVGPFCGYRFTIFPVDCSAEAAVV